jgi:circadian clock protein KaiB
LNSHPSHFPHLFKGIALFTPGGDLIYCIDPSKKKRWHLQLCATLQELLGLPEPPHFLVPGYTATFDQWLDPQTQQLHWSAEISLLVKRHQELLNAVFGISHLTWQVTPWQEKFCNPIVLETYRSQFPQLWENHDLIVRHEYNGRFSRSETRRSSLPWQNLSGENQVAIADDAASTTSYNQLESITPLSPAPVTRAYVLRLFVSGHNAATEDSLKKLHQLLEQSLTHPYTLKVIDIFKHPEQAEANQISATPTLLRVSPLPVRRLVGEFNDAEKVIRILNTLESSVNLPEL